MKIALITGITGQDGSYLAEFLLKKGYEVHGIIRRSSSFNTKRIDHLYRDPHEKNVKLFLHYGDMTDSTNLIRLFQEIGPDEIYNLAAQSHVKVSFETPEYTANADALGTLRLLEAIKLLKLENKTRFYQASTSELFGKVTEIPQKETTPFYPRSPYAAAKLYSYWITINYREAYGIFACNGILFNHESPRRGETFVTRKITRAATRIVLGLQEKLFLGNLNAKRDWGYAPEYVDAMWRILQQSEPSDYVIATGETHSVREFCEKTFENLGITVEWVGNGIDERGVINKINHETILEKIRTSIDTNNIANIYKVDFKFLKKKLKQRLEVGKVIVEIDPRYFRPTEVDILVGDYSKAREKLGWEPKTKFRDLVRIMVENDLKLAILEKYREEKIRE